MKKENDSPSVCTKLGDSNAYQNPLDLRLGRGFLKQIPKSPGVYAFVDEQGSPLYIGKAVNLRKRLLSYWLLRPGSQRDHLLEMIQAASTVTWEVCESEERALHREKDLIRDILPPYNIAGTWQANDFWLRLDTQITGDSEAVAIRFELIFERQPLSSGMTYGCIRNDLTSKRGYPALLRLLNVLGNSSRWFHHPASIDGKKIPYRFKARLPQKFMRDLLLFLKGRNMKLLREISLELLKNDSLPRFLARSIENDLYWARDFFMKNLRPIPLARKHFGLLGRNALLSSKQIRGFVRARRLEQTSLCPPTSAKGIKRPACFAP